MAYKRKKEMDTTTNSRIYKLNLKLVRESRHEIFCSRCPYHGGENSTRKDFRSWKTMTKRKKQYKVR